MCETACETFAFSSQSLFLASVGVLCWSPLSLISRHPAAAAAAAAVAATPLAPAEVYLGPAVHRSWPGLHLVITHSGNTSSLWEAICHNGPEPRGFVYPLAPLAEAGAPQPVPPKPWFELAVQLPVPRPSLLSLHTLHHVCPLPRAPAGLPHLVSEHKGFARESKLMQQTTLEHEDAPAAQQGSGADAAADAAAASSVAAGPPVSQSPVKPRHLRVHIGQMRLERTPSSWTMKQTRLQLHGPASDDPQSHSVSASALQLDLLESHLPHAWGMWPTQWVVRDLAGPDPNATVAQMRWAGVAESIKASVDKKAYVHIAPEYEKHASFVLMALMQSYLNNIRA